MNFTEMSIDELLERRAAIAGEIEADGADLDALEAEVRGINSELENRKNEEAKKAELRAAVAAGQGEVIKKLEPAERNIPTMEEIRSTHEYNVAYANYIKTPGGQLGAPLASVLLLFYGSRDCTQQCILPGDFLSRAYHCHP